MSIKIYQAWRIPLNKLQSFTKWYDAKCTEHVTKVISSCLRECDEKKTKELKELWLSRHPDGRKDILEYEHFTRLFQLIKLYVDYRIISARRENDLCNFDSSFNAFIDKDYAYIIPYFPCGLRGVKVPEYCEDYSYWDNTDEPENVSAKEWNQRRKTWDKMALNDWNVFRFSHVLFEGRDDSITFGLDKVIAKLLPNDKYGEFKWYVVGCTDSVIRKMRLMSNVKRVEMSDKILKEPFDIMVSGDILFE